MRRIVNILLWVFAVLTVSDLSAQSDDKSQGTHHIEQLAQSVRALGNYAVRFTIVSGDYSSTGEYTVGGEEYHLLFAQYEAFGDAKLRYEVDHSRREVVIDKVLEEAGFELRLPSCSACLAMNPDKVPAGKLSISTSNRNFVGRQGPGARTILASPLVVAASAVTGVITDPRKL